MHPTQGVVGDTELARIVRNDHRAAEQSMVADRPPDCRLRDRTQKLSVENIDALADQMLEDAAWSANIAGRLIWSFVMIACSTPCAFSQVIASSLRT